MPEPHRKIRNNHPEKALLQMGYLSRLLLLKLLLLTINYFLGKKKNNTSKRQTSGKLLIHKKVFSSQYLPLHPAKKRVAEHRQTVPEYAATPDLLSNPDTHRTVN